MPVVRYQYLYRQSGVHPECIHQHPVVALDVEKVIDEPGAGGTHHSDGLLHFCQDACVIVLVMPIIENAFYAHLLITVQSLKRTNRHHKSQKENYEARNEPTQNTNGFGRVFVDKVIPNARSYRD